MSFRPTFPEFMLTARLDGEEKQLSAGYIQKTLATARLFFTWLSDYELGYRNIKQAWIKTIKTKRLTEAPRNKEAVTFDEIIRIARAPAASLVERRARAAAVFLWLSGMRIGAFVSLPIQAVDIPNRTVTQYPSLGVKTKNRKFAVTTLYDIPELIKVVQEWDEEIRKVLPSNGFWFAPISPQTGKIDAAITSIGEHRINLARRNIKAWLENVGLPYHSPHKFRHGHVQFGSAHAKTHADYKAVSLNVMHSSVGITDQFYSNISDEEVHNRIGLLTNGEQKESEDQETLRLLQEFLEWKNRRPGLGGG